VALYILLWAADKSGRSASTEGVAPARKEVGSNYRAIVSAFHGAILIPFLALGSTNHRCLANPAWPAVYLLALQISTLFMAHKGVVGGGGRALAGNIWQHAKPKPFVAASVGCTVNNWG